MWFFGGDELRDDDFEHLAHAMSGFNAASDLPGSSGYTHKSVLPDSFGNLPASSCSDLGTAASAASYNDITQLGHGKTTRMCIKSANFDRSR